MLKNNEKGVLNLTNNEAISMLPFCNRFCNNIFRSKSKMKKEKKKERLNYFEMNIIFERMNLSDIKLLLYNRRSCCYNYYYRRSIFNCIVIVTLNYD